MTPRILHHGARDGVTGSCHELQIDAGSALLIDCGLFQGAETSADGRAANERLDIEFPVAHLRALIVTHVHIDHVGRIPWLLAAGFDGPILCSEPSARLLPIVLEDAFALGISRDRRYIDEYLRMLQRRIVALPYGRWYAGPDPRCRIRLQRAGHILGSAYVECDVDGDAGRATRVVFSGDLGASHTPLLPAPRPPGRADVVVLESTYGDRLHEARARRREQLQAVVEKALADGGTVMIPAFSIGRTQELLYELEDIIHRQGKRPGRMSSDWAKLPIFLDSPLASRFTRAYRELQPHWDAEALSRVRAGRRPLDFAQVVTIDEHAEHLENVRRLARSGQPAIVIAGGGMCTSGRIVNYLAAMLHDPRHDVVFVGYQARGSTGHAIQTHGPRGGYVELDGQRIDIRARIHTLPGYSAHADQAGLTRFVTGMRKPPREVRLVHGDSEARRTLQQHLRAATGGQVEIVLP